jgi:hypothetical protein
VGSPPNFTEKFPAFPFQAQTLYEFCCAVGSLCFTPSAREAHFGPDVERFSTFPMLSGEAKSCKSFFFGSNFVSLFSPRLVYLVNFQTVELNLTNLAKTKICIIQNYITADQSQYYTAIGGKNAHFLEEFRESLHRYTSATTHKRPISVNLLPSVYLNTPNVSLSEIFNSMFVFVGKSITSRPPRAVPFVFFRERLPSPLSPDLTSDKQRFLFLFFCFKLTHAKTSFNEFNRWLDIAHY